MNASSEAHPLPTEPRPRLTLGPLLFNWPAERRLDFYARIADEAPIDVVYLGEVVCSKRAPFVDPLLPEIAQRLERAGKEVVYSTLALVMSPREREGLQTLTAEPGLRFEANDATALALLAGRPHVVGPFVNLYNEGTLAWLAGNGAVRAVLPAELPAASIERLAAWRSASAPDLAIEVQAFGRLPLALSARCYHARAHGLSKDGCRYVCGEDADGLGVATVEHQPFLAINGTMTMSHAVHCPARAMPGLVAAGVGLFRLWPQAIDMVAVAAAFRALLDGRAETGQTLARLAGLVPFAPLADGYLRGMAGAELAPEE
ncbi:MAG: ubiquinone anaerobic biosynthesis protein UbiV [Pseudomonadota bacterium]